MDNKASITALMSSFGRAFQAENADHPVFADHLAKNLMTAEEYAAVQASALSGSLSVSRRIGRTDMRMSPCVVPLKISATRTKSCQSFKGFLSSTGVSPHSR